MRKQPPLLPLETLRRVIRVARVNGTSVLVIASLVALASAAGQDRFDTFVGLAIAASGAFEVHGTVLLGGGARRGLRWLILSQFLLLFIMLGYVWYRMAHVDVSLIAQLVPDSQLRQVAVQYGLSVANLKLELYLGMYFMIAVGTIVYQGAMIAYYGLRTRAIQAALPLERPS